MKQLYRFFLLCLCLALPVAEAGEDAAVSAVLDRFHAAASKAQFDDYFAQFTDDGVFIGTDASERWTVPQFQAYARPHFDKGRGWTYTKVERHISLAPDGSHAWFDELLDNASLGRCRGSGVLRKVAGQWKIAQYHLTIPVPNALADEFAKRIRAAAPG
ncbi:nuclear transport factor 2 family protein [Chitinimonas sp.]|uniref:nuclear transport factor 2 family protein n=1 Tax=Chitinimonas sp. TaxID=1934313 RepID=UPI0035AD7D37